MKLNLLLICIVQQVFGDPLALIHRSNNEHDQCVNRRECFLSGGFINPLNCKCVENVCSEMVKIKCTADGLFLDPIGCECHPISCSIHSEAFWSLDCPHGEDADPTTCSCQPKKENCLKNDSFAVCKKIGKLINPVDCKCEDLLGSCPDTSSLYVKRAVWCFNDNNGKIVNPLNCRCISGSCSRPSDAYKNKFQECVENGEIVDEATCGCIPGSCIEESERFLSLNCLHGTHADAVTCRCKPNKSLVYVSHHDHPSSSFNGLGPGHGFGFEHNQHNHHDNCADRTECLNSGGLLNPVTCKCTENYCSEAVKTVCAAKDQLINPTTCTCTPDSCRKNSVAFLLKSKQCSAAQDVNPVTCTCEHKLVNCDPRKCITTNTLQDPANCDCLVRTYTVVKTAVTWTGAKKRCENMGARLAQPVNEEENEHIKSELLDINNQVWFGLEKVKNVWQYTDGSVPGFTDWGPGMPSGDGKCGSYLGNNLWNDAPCKRKFFYICENLDKSCPETSIDYITMACTPGNELPLVNAVNCSCIADSCMEQSSAYEKKYGTCEALGQVVDRITCACVQGSCIETSDRFQSLKCPHGEHADPVTCRCRKETEKDSTSVALVPYRKPSKHHKHENSSGKNIGHSKKHHKSCHHGGFGYYQPGPPGPKGDRGDQGQQGIQGRDGRDGHKGDAGINGHKGEKGKTGDKGDRGKPGNPGRNGHKGDPGIRGPAGPPPDLDHLELLVRDLIEEVLSDHYKGHTAPTKSHGQSRKRPKW